MARPRRENPWDHWRPHGGGPAPELVPIFGVKAFSAASTCDDVHPRGPIPGGSRCMCAVCHKSGVDHLTRDHTKPGNGQLREGWDAPEPTRYLPPAQSTPGKPGKPPLRGGIGR